MGRGKEGERGLRLALQSFGQSRAWGVLGLSIGVFMILCWSWEWWTPQSRGLQRARRCFAVASHPLESLETTRKLSTKFDSCWFCWKTHMESKRDVSQYRQEGSR